MPGLLKRSSMLLLLLLAACRSDPIHYHTLTPVNRGAGAQVGDVDIRVEQVTVPPQVDRSQLVIRQGDSGLAILETQWWGASLADELHSALVEQLGGKPGGRVIGLRVDVIRFDSVPGRYALLEARWRLREGAVAALTCRSVVQSPAGAGLDALVSAHQQNLARLVQDVAAATRGGLLQCPEGR